MKKYFLFTALISAIFLFCGCSGPGTFGGGSGGGNSSKYNSGSMSVTVNWPDQGKGSVLSLAYSLKINVCTEVIKTGSPTTYERQVPAALITRAADNSSESATINGIPAGARTVIVQAFDGDASEIGCGTRAVTIKQGDNDGINISLIAGSFGYYINGPGDVTTPTRSNPQSAPQISYISPRLGAAGDLVTIYGANFGSAQGLSTLSFSGTSITSVKSWSDTKIEFYVPSTASSGTNYIAVKVNITQSNTVGFTVITQNTPNISTISPTSGPVGTQVTVNGSNFGPTQGSSTVTFNGTAAASIGSWTDIKITCTVPAGASSGFVKVTVNNISSNSVAFTVPQWSQMTSGVVANLNAVTGTASDNVYAVGANGAARKYDGSGWIPFASPSGTITISSICIPFASTLQVGCEENSNVYTYTGTSWSAGNSACPKPVKGVWSTSTANLYAVGGAGTVRRYTGSVWGTVANGLTGEQLNGIWGFDANNIYVAGNNGALIYYHGANGGWGIAAGLTSKNLYAAWGSAINDLFVVGDSGMILHSADGTTWAQMVSGTTNCLYAVWGTSSTNVYTVGANGTILHYDGTTWSAMESGVTVDIYGIWGSSASDIFAVGAGGVILHYTGQEYSVAP